jgi:hypothetical protein
MTESRTSPDIEDEPLVPAPDDKDWTWVLHRRCPECGVAASELAPERVTVEIADTARRWRAVLARPDAARRPSDAVWSPLEYGCHVRDVYRTFAERAAGMLAEDRPTFANWDQDATALQQRYWAQDRSTVSIELQTAAQGAAEVFGSVSGDEWQRPGVRSNGSSFTVVTLAQYFLHDVHHHLHDVGG